MKSNEGLRLERKTSGKKPRGARSFTRHGVFELVVAVNPTHARQGTAALWRVTL